MMFEGRNLTAAQVQTEIFRRKTQAERIDCCRKWTELTLELAR